MSDEIVLRALKYARVPGVTIAEVTRRFGITRARFARARKTRGHEVTWTLEDILLSALMRGGTHRAADLVGYVDWLEHARHDPSELETVFEGLRERGLVERTTDGWRIVVEWP